MAGIKFGTTGQIVVSFNVSVKPTRIIRNGPALVVFWDDGTKTVVKCHDEEFDAEKGLAMALARKLWGRCQTKRYVESIHDQNAIDPAEVEAATMRLMRRR